MVAVRGDLFAAGLSLRATAWTPSNRCGRRYPGGVSARSPEAIRQFDYDRRKGSFRGWLIAVARSKLQNFLDKRQATNRGIGGTEALKLIEQQPAAEDEDAFVEREHRRCLFDWAVRQFASEFQESTWQAFWQTSVEGKKQQRGRRSLGMTVGAVYIARSRVLARLKETIQQVEE